MNATSIRSPNRVFPFQSISQRLKLEYDEIDAKLDRVFADIFREFVSRPALQELGPRVAALVPLVIYL